MGVNRVLIVDDVAINRTVLRATLEAAGYAVFEAADGVEALALLEREPVNAIISDILMPNMDGYVLCQEIRKNERFHALPFIFYSGTHRSAPDEKMAMEVGGDMFLGKPAEVPVLLDALRTVTSARRSVSRSAPTLPEELSQMKRYSARLVNQLEEQNTKLRQRTLDLQTEIAERSRAEETLRESEERFRQLAENISAVFWITDPRKKQILYVSPASEKIWGRSRETLYQSPEAWTKAIHPEDRERVRHAAIERDPPGAYDDTYRIVWPDGAVRWVHDRAFPMRDEHGQAYRVVGIAEDITEQKASQRQLEYSFKRLQALSRRLIEVREDEWQHLSTELHDRIGQTLTALGINLNVITVSLPPGSPDKLMARLRDSRVLLETAIASVRDLITEVRPPALADYGLLAGLRGYCEKLAVRTAVAIRVEGNEPEPRLPPGPENALFRISQEALSNVVKHAQARDVLVKLEVTPEWVTLTVLDDGRGYNVAGQASDERSHWGLVIMQERAEAIGAQFRVDSTPGRGTCVTVRAPRKP